MVKYTLWGKEVDLDISKENFPTEEERKEMEALLPGCQHGWFQSTYKGMQLHYYKFLPPENTKPVGVVVFTHGIQGHSGRAVATKDGRKVNMSLLSSECLKRGYALYAPELLGHGFSEGKRFYVPDYRVNRDDLDNFARSVASKEHPDIPLFLAGESYGSCLTLHVAREWQNNSKGPDGFAGVVVTAPAVIGDLPPYPVVFTLRYLFAPLAPLWVPFFMPNPVNADRIWSVEEVRDWYTNPRRMASLDGGGRPFRLGTAVSLLNATEAVRSEVIPGLAVPFCACHGTEDAAVPIKSLEYLETHAVTPKEDRAVLRQEGCYHDMLAEPSAQETADFMMKFMEERIVDRMKSLKN